MSTKKLSLDHLARVEGHGVAHVSIKNGAVESVKMEVNEPARFFEGMARGRNYIEVPYISSRICGICSANHAITSILAIEGAFDVQVSERTQAIRELLVYGSYLQNHATHLYVLAAPDYLKMPSIFPLAEANEALFDRALALKALGNELCNKVGGRSIHPITAVPGGFTHELSAAEYMELAQKLEDMVPFAEETVDIFNSFPVPAIKMSGDMMAMSKEDAYPISLSTQACFVRSGQIFEANDLHSMIEEYAVPHSGALFAREKATQNTYMVGALARINASWNHLSQTAKIAAAKAGLRPPELNPFMNNVAQAVELVDACVRCAQICRKLAANEYEGSSTPVQITPKAGHAIGFTEAPRGSVYHDIEFDAAGRVVHAAIITPTAQNVANLEADMLTLAEYLLEQGADEDQIRLEVEKLVRAYDPCFSCSVH